MSIKVGIGVVQSRASSIVSGRYVDARLAELRSGSDQLGDGPATLTSLAPTSLTRKTKNRSCYRWETKEGRNEYQRQRRQTPEGRLEMMRVNLKATHGLTLDQYQDLYERQRGMCAICGRQMVKGYDASSVAFSKRGPKEGGAHIDHDHRCCAGSKSCGRCVRGLLCPKCNTGIACFLDDPKRMRSAIEYIERGRVR